MNKQYKIILISSIALSIALISGAAFLALKPETKTPNNSSNTNASNKEKLPIFTSKQLAVSNGKNNAPCYVAIEDTVYSIKQGNTWINGEHTSSEGLAYCGKDLTDALSKSPHGKSKLPALSIVGKYKKAI